MLVGTVIGVLIIPGLYYIFGRLADGRKLLKDESHAPLSEIFEHRPLEADSSEYPIPHTGPVPEGFPGESEADLPEAAEIPDSTPPPGPESHHAGP
jgi:HAE1 family hydrophobic/amphiphilic exporter-1